MTVTDFSRLLHINLLRFVLIIQCYTFVFCKPKLDSASDEHIMPKRILIFGGNGFMGSAAAERLLSAGHTLTLVNRGNWYWDTAITIKPYVEQITCDRGQTLVKCTKLVDLVQNNTFDVVIDFSAYHPFAMQEAVKLIGSRAKLYIYISSDSVYDVCLKNHSDPTLETDAVRPTSAEIRQSLEAKEDYGHRKLECEEVLQAQRENGGIPYITLRLPDVIGPRDNTYRWWIYQLWIRLQKHLEKPLSVPESLLIRPMSLVYSEDVADVIVDCLHAGPDIIDQAYNLAFIETPSLFTVISDIKEALDLSDIKTRTDTGDEPMYLFPSVRLGPIDITKAHQLLGWKPTPWATAVKETVSFYEKAISNVNFEIARRDIIRTMQTYFTSRPLKVIVGLKREYGVTYESPQLSKDEL